MHDHKLSLRCACGEEPTAAVLDYLFEKLAAIEHERWADWQIYVHSKMTPSADDGIWLIGEAFINRWERQIRTPYAELTEEEKESDRNQVRRYWDLITVPNERSEESAVDKFLKGDGAIQAERTRIIKALEGLKVEALMHPMQVLDKERVHQLDNYGAGFDSALDQAIKAVEKGNK